VLGRAHSDPELRFAARHYHYDLRFFTEEEMYELVGTVNSPDGSGCSVMNAALIRVSTVTSGVVHRRLECRHVMPDFPAFTGDGDPAATALILGPIYALRHIEPANLICPHRRFPSFPPWQNYVIIAG